MPAQLYVIDRTAERRDHKALQEIRGGLLAHVGELGRGIASPSGAHIGEDLLAWDQHVCATFKLIDKAAGILDHSN